MGSDDREKALELAFTQIEKQFGKGSIMKLGEAESLTGISTISTGSISLDHALGVGQKGLKFDILSSREHW